MMNRRHMIEEIRQMVRDACRSDANAYGYGIWSHHVKQVAQHAEELAPVLGADREVVEIAALLHDIASIRDERDRAYHHEVGALQAQEILAPYDYPPEKVELVTRCIMSHRASIPTSRSTPEEVCISSADAMAHISEVPSLLYLAYVRKGLDIDDGKRWVSDKLRRSWTKLCEAAQDMMLTQYHSALITLQDPSTRSLDGDVSSGSSGRVPRAVSRNDNASSG